MYQHDKNTRRRYERAKFPQIRCRVIVGLKYVPIEKVRGATV